MSQVDKLIEKIKKSKDETNDFWINCYEEMQTILNSNLPKKEKDKLLKLGFGEVILMMYDGIVGIKK